MIKFRAWIKTGIETYDYVEPMTIQQMIHSKKSTFSLKQLNDLVDFEQFTGLIDVNGKEIYEGDIIQYSDHFYAYSIDGVPDRETKYIGVVAKNNWSLGILINRIIHTDEHIGHYNAKEFVPFCEFDNPEADVLLKGNIHANPELVAPNNELV